MNLTEEDVRKFEVTLQQMMDATADMIDIFGKAAKDCGVE